MMGTSDKQLSEKVWDLSVEATITSITPYVSECEQTALAILKCLIARREG